MPLLLPPFPSPRIKTTAIRSQGEQFGLFHVLFSLIFEQEFDRKGFIYLLFSCFPFPRPIQEQENAAADRITLYRSSPRSIERADKMNGLSNIFSILNLDAADDKEQVASLSSSNSDSHAKTSDGKKKKGKSVESESLENSKSLNGSVEEPATSGDYRMPLVWIDLEMTGLDIEVDRILEIACVVTDGKLTKSVDGPDLVIKQTKECLDKMGEWCSNHHGASGLTQRVLESTVTEEDAEKQVIDFVKKHVGSDTPLLAGNSIYVDYIFLKKYMPSLAAVFPHVLVDVSSIMALCIRWFPKEKKGAPAKAKKHRAMDDIKESIRELKYYKEAIFKGPNKSKR